MTHPLPISKSTRLNRTLHGRSIHRKKDVPGHNVFRYYSTPGKGDGIDLFAAAGTPVVAVHDGVISRVMQDGTVSEGCYITGCGSVTVYGHINLKPTIHLGHEVKEGECIGYVGKLLKDPHLHFEMEHDGVVVSGKTAKLMLTELLQVFE